MFSEADVDKPKGPMAGNPSTGPVYVEGIHANDVIAVHIRVQRDGAWFCCGDGHAVQGDGEINGYSLEVSLEGRLRIEQSPYQSLKTILIETPGKFITVGIEHEWDEAVRSAVYAMADHLSRYKGLSLLDAYQCVSHVGDMRLGAIWPVWSRHDWAKDIPIPACLHLSKEFFT